MPLPPALQARLMKRGLIKDEEKEEKKEEEEENEYGKGCPNVSNPYHTCVDYCFKRWGPPKKDDKENENKTVSEKPLPPGWFKVPDPQSGHSYFWNVHSNQVSWLHPNDPKANVSMPAAWIQAQQLQKEKETQPTPPGEEESNSEEIESKDIEKGRKKDPPKIKTGKHPSLIKAQKHKEKYGKRKKTEHRDELDPMDPASYADVPRGSWSTGLKDQGDAKTGVDTTANGPLFQQRPYPSPGEVLRRNQKLKEAEEDDDD